jgi:hypothetical protein
VAEVADAAAGGAMGWMRRLNAHPLVAEALTGGRVTASYARKICDWSERLPEDVRVRVAGGAAIRPPAVPRPPEHRRLRTA